MVRADRRLLVQRRYPAESLPPRRCLERRRVAARFPRLRLLPCGTRRRLSTQKSSLLLHRGCQVGEEDSCNFRGESFYSIDGLRVMPEKIVEWRERRGFSIGNMDD